MTTDDLRIYAFQLLCIHLYHFTPRGSTVRDNLKRVSSLAQFFGELQLLKRRYPDVRFRFLSHLLLYTAPTFQITSIRLRQLKLNNFFRKTLRELQTKTRSIVSLLTQRR